MTKAQQSYITVGSWVLIVGDQTSTPHKIVSIENGSYTFYHLDDGYPYSLDELDICKAEDYESELYDYLDYLDSIYPDAYNRFQLRMPWWHRDEDLFVSVHEFQYAVKQAYPNVNKEIQL